MVPDDYYTKLCLTPFHYFSMYGISFMNDSHTYVHCVGVDEFLSSLSIVLSLY